MTLRFKSIVCIFFIPLISACAAAKFPEAGTATPYDGQWSAQLPAERTICDGIESKFEVRYGMIIGTVTEKGHRIAEIWGQIDDKGHLEGLIGQLGITGATASVDFQEKTATGTWKNNSCKGTLTAAKHG